MILFVWQMTHPTTPPQPVAAMPASTSSSGDALLPQAASGAAVPGQAATDTAALSKSEALAATPRIAISSERVKGSIALTGARFDDITLVNYRKELDPKSPPVDMLLPSRTAEAYFAELGWAAAGTTGTTLPTADTLWQADHSVLTPEQPVTLSWDNGGGLRFVTRIALDAHYMFTITRRVENYGSAPVTLAPYGLLNRVHEQKEQAFAISHEGPLGVFGGTLNEEAYSDLQKDGPQQYNSVGENTRGGWVGIADKYWFTALIPDQDVPFTGRFTYIGKDGEPRYQADFLSDAVTVPANGAAEVGARLYAGPKEVALLDHYVTDENVPLFDRAVDFGVLYFLTKPIFLALQFFYHWIGNFGIAILILTVCIKLLLFPLANKSYVAINRMKLIQPKMMELREKYADDKMKMQQEVMALYKKEKVNPASGCLPILIQIPIFFALYKVLFVTIEMRHAPFYGWIHDLSIPDPTSIFNLFGLISWQPPEMLMIGAWPCIMCIAMVLQQKMNPKPTDPTQEKIMRLLPLMFLFMFAHFPAGLIIYWAWNTGLSVVQQYAITRLYAKKKPA
ncbi:MAG: membrane protein insertase YidC [Alphaproteobacteria bacterium]|nr:membrane protein insertase YidC [Alphaproteobacteria bacterium]